ncbi:MAG: hypothetical protein [Bacteriophage sp.]|nr:MAG: hypothetical protein [Bacteriophage sp.]
MKYAITDQGKIVYTNYIFLQDLRSEPILHLPNRTAKEVMCNQIEQAIHILSRYNGLRTRADDLVKMYETQPSAIPMKGHLETQEGGMIVFVAG